MALPLGHALIGASVAALLVPNQPRHELKTVLTSALIAVVPDFDYVFYRVFDWGEAWHRSFSHSLVFALVLGGLVTLVFGPRRTRYFVIYAAAIFSHAILDGLVSEQGGVELFWPFSDRMIHFGLVAYPNIFRGQADFLTIARRICEYSFVEAVIFGSILLLVLWARTFSRRRSVLPQEW